MSAGKTLTLTAAQASGKTINGAGDVTVNALNSTPGAVLAGITATGTVTVNTGDNFTFIGTFPDTNTTLAGAFTYTVNSAAFSGNAYTVSGTTSVISTAEFLNNKTIVGAGDVTVNALHSTPGAVLAGITATGTVTVNTGSNFTFSGTFPNTNTTLAEAFTYTVDNNAAFTNGKTYTVSTGTTVESTAQFLNNKTIVGDGDVTVNALHSTSTALLAGITATGTVTVNTGDNFTFTGTFPDTNTTLAEAFTYTVNSAAFSGNAYTVSGTTSVISTAQFLNNKTIVGAGDVTVNALHSTSTALLAGITATGTVTVNTGDNFTFTGTFPNTNTTLAEAFTYTVDNNAAFTNGKTYTVSTGTTVESTAQFLNNKTIVGAGDVTVNALHSTPGAVLAGITATGTVTVNTGDNFTFTGTFPNTNTTLAEAFTYTVDNNAAFTNGKTYTVSTGTTVESTAQFLNNKTIVGDGDVTVNALHSTSTALLAGITATGTVTVNTGDNFTFTGTFPDTNTTLAEAFTYTVDNNAAFTNGKTYTVSTGTTVESTAQFLNNKTIVGDGDVTVNALHSTSTALLAGITATGTVTVNTGDNFTFTGTFPNTNTTLAEAFTYTVDNNAAFTNGKTYTVSGTTSVISTAQFLNNKTIVGAGDVTVNALHSTSTALLAGITATGTVTVNTGDNFTFTGTFPNTNTTLAEAFTYTVDNNAAFTNGKTYTVSTGTTVESTAEFLNNKTIVGAGDVTVNALHSTSTALLAGITATGTVTVNTGDNFTFTGTFPDTNTTLAGAFTYTVNSAAFSGNAYTVSGTTSVISTAQFLNNKTIVGAGDVTVNALHSTSTALLAGITATGTVTVNTGDNFTFTGTFPNTNTTLAEAFTYTVDNNAAFTNGKTYTVSTGTTVESTAEFLNNKTIVGAGDVTVNALHSTSTALLAGITATGTVTVNTGDNFTFTGTFPNTNTTLAEAFTYTVDNNAAFTNGKTYTVSTGTTVESTAQFLNNKTIVGDGDVTVNALHSTSTALLAGITATGTVTVNTGDNFTFTGTFPDTNTTLAGAFTYTVNSAAFSGNAYTVSGTTSVISTAQFLNNKTIVGAGNLDVTALTLDEYDGSNINITGTYKIGLSGIINSATNFKPSEVGSTSPNLVPTGNITVKGSIISDLTIDDGASGVNDVSVIVNRFAVTDNGNYRGIKVTTCTYTVNSDGPTEVTFTGKYKNDSTEIKFNIVNTYTAIFSQNNANVAEILQFSSTGLLAEQSFKIITFIGTGTLKLEIDPNSTITSTTPNIMQFTDTDFHTIFNTDYGGLVSSSIYTINKTAENIPIITIVNV